MKLSEYLDKYKDSNITVCILNMRNLGDLTAKEVNELHEFLWKKNRLVMDQYQY